MWIEFEGKDEKDLQSNDITLEGVELSYCFSLGGSVGVLICNEASSSKAIFFVTSCIKKKEKKRGICHQACSCERWQRKLGSMLKHFGWWLIGSKVRKVGIYIFCVGGSVKARALLACGGELSWIFCPQAMLWCWDEY